MGPKLLVPLSSSNGLNGREQLLTKGNHSSPRINTEPNGTG